MEAAKTIYFQILLYITDQRVVDLLRRQQINSYVEHNSRLRWCPTQGCEKAVRVGFLNTIFGSSSIGAIVYNAKYSLY